MKPEYYDELRREIAEHESNASYMAQGMFPLFVASHHSKIVIVGQAPGARAQTSGLAWDDASGRRLVQWLGVTEEQFRNLELFAHIPMDFYYPGKGKSGDLPPRKTFAPLWHDRFMQNMRHVELTILIGKYAQAHYLGKRTQRNLTETVRNYDAYLPEYFPLVHPSPLNFRWFAKNEWFEHELVPDLQRRVADIINR
jgi:uracil-DNA glycosylase